jgi:hypothetical protein
VDAVELEVDELTDAQPGRPLNEEGVRVEAVGRRLESGHEAAIRVGRQVAG